MNACTNCGSYAINPHLHGRGGDRLNLYDVCYWRARFDALREAVAWERECQAFTYRKPLSIDAMKALLRTRYAARAEVDRLMGEG